MFNHFTTVAAGYFGEWITVKAIVLKHNYSTYSTKETIIKIIQ